MFQCPNCGGNVRFDIPSQMLACEYCGTKLDPYSYENKTSDGVETADPENYEVTVFTCPQCGGEILSTDTTAAGFCSFCGASTILYSRISREHRPNYIIPFKKTKDDCKMAYSELMKKAIFAPKELKDPQKIDGFRGIYMPYWAFYVTQNGPISIPAEKSHRSGDYIITDHFQLTGEVDSYYKGLSYDASSSFADNISEAIAPYDVKGMKKFTPAFLSGFYADTADVDSDVYRHDAEQTAYRESAAKLKADPAFRGYSIHAAQLEHSAVSHSCTKEVDQAMFPVWFMSYRNGDRVAYATVNGQTGKVVADIPVDLKKFLIASLVLAVPIFVLLNLFFTVIPTTALTITGILAVLALALSGSMICRIVKRENHEDDRGMLFRMNPQKLKELTQKNTSEQAKQTAKTKQTIAAKLVSVMFMGAVFAVLFGSFAMNLLKSGLIWGGILVVGFIAAIVGLLKIQDVPGKKGLPGIVLTSAGLVVSAAMVVIRPVSDVWYYGAVIFLIAAVAVMEKELIEQYNLTATRRLPQFDKQGGDDRA
jgi:DNA-directed RNA polymerase subunit RPC12/RpoP/F0F1-type ATP synthase assembly protein I